MAMVKRSRNVILFTWRVIGESEVEHCWLAEDVEETDTYLGLYAPALCGYMPEVAKPEKLSGKECKGCRKKRNAGVN